MAKQEANTRTRRFACDFETTTRNEEQCVWSFGAYDFTSGEYYKGISIEDFFDFIEGEDGEEKILYFHNLKFDGSYILNWLLRNGYTQVESEARQKIKPYEFTANVDEMGSWYSINVNIGDVQVTILDSLKLLPMSIAAIADGFELEIKKGSIDYNKERPKGYIPTAEEAEYQYNDCWILGNALKKFEEIVGSKPKTTIASTALKDFKSIIGYKKFNEMYKNKLTDKIDNDIRTGYCGGLCYLNPDFKEQLLTVSSIDVNSMYPSIMYDYYLPYGTPTLIYPTSLELDEDKLYIVKINGRFILKDGKLPCIQHKTSRYGKNKYVVDSEVNIDIIRPLEEVKLILKHYEVKDLRIKYAYAFEKENENFKLYIQKWYDGKTKAKLEHNSSLKIICKLFLNSCYGKFGAAQTTTKKQFYLNEGILRGVDAYTDEDCMLYLPVAMFITSYARVKLVKTAQKIHEQGKFIYCDTDSVHFIDGANLDGIEISNTKLGAWDLEESGVVGKYLRQKTYLHKDGDKYECKCCGMPNECKKHVNFDNFNIGETFNGKLMYRQCKGGAKLVETTFTIK